LETETFGAGLGCYWSWAGLLRALSSDLDSAICAIVPGRSTVWTEELGAEFLIVSQFPLGLCSSLDRVSGVMAA
jgi:hypothetical protein